MDYEKTRCPGCSSGLAPIIYGYPNTDMVEYAIQEIIALGGPKIQEYSHYCYSCDELYVID